MEAILTPIFFRNLRCMINPSIRSYKNKFYIFTFHVEDHGNYLIARAFKTNNFLLSEQKFTRDKSKIIKKDGTEVKLKTEEIPKINLVHESKQLMVTLEEAKKIAKHKGLNLIKVDSSQKSKEVYKLITDTDLLKGEKKKSYQNKLKKNKEKIFKFTSKISDYDIKIKAKNIARSFKSCNSVRCCIKFDDEQVTDTIFEKIMNELGSAYTAKRIPSGPNILQFILYNSEEENKNESN